MNYTFEERDEYQRKKIAINIKRLISYGIDISPIVIDGEWGTGKTEFCLKLQNFFSTDDIGCKVIYIDAFKEDHSDDPLLTMTAAIAAVLPPKEKTALISKAIPALKFGLKTTLKAGSNWLLRNNVDQLAEEFKDSLINTNNAIIDNTIESLIQEHIDLDGNLNALREKLKEISTNNKIIIIIDELDRCRPSYSVNLLEKIKHIFNVENVYFLLTTNKSQLQASVNHIYGSSINSKQYLDKFIKYTISLPLTHNDDYNYLIYNSIKHWDLLSNNSEKLKEVNNEYGSHIKDILMIKALSLREIETFARHLEIYQILADECAIKPRSPLCQALTRLISVYFSCFGEDTSNIDSFNKEALKKIMKSLRFESFPVDLTQNSKTPYYYYVIYGLMKEINFNPTSYIANDQAIQETIKFLDERYARMTFLNFSDYSYSKTLMKSLRILSFQSI
ncbi:P-loop NTPase fold protein [Atlantibacter sp. RC6]|uniref:KAP family P-loop NTPase fold protein n=1 Tax=Atlantibacter sp. RC6 TaxID=2587036 RepID=UPI001606796F|nr:hypothetical protein [Atlantibacter sp. RC6]